jgi:hypothetical protein
VDPVARRFFIAHGLVVQVVDLNTGTLASRIAGWREAYAIDRLDAQAIATLLRRSSAGAASIQPAIAQSSPASSSPAKQLVTPTVLDWSHESRLPESAEDSMSIFSLKSDCLEPQGLAIDSSHQRLLRAVTI